MEPEGSSPHSQAHATCPYPEPAPSSPHTHFPKIHPNIILPSKPGSPLWSPSLRFPLFRWRACLLRDASSRNTLTRRSEWGSNLPPDCFVSRGSISHMCFVIKVFLRRVVSTSPNPQAGGPPCVGCPRLLIQYIAATLLTGGRSSIRNPRTRHAVVTETNL